MSIAYIVSKKEIDVLHAMVCEKEWNGDEDELSVVLKNLTQKGFIVKKDSSFTIERVIYGLIKAMEQTTQKNIITDGRNTLYKNPGLWIFLEKDMHSQLNFKLRAFQGRIPFEESEEGRKFFKDYE